MNQSSREMVRIAISINSMEKIGFGGSHISVTVLARDKPLSQYQDSQIIIAQGI